MSRWRTFVVPVLLLLLWEAGGYLTINPVYLPRVSEIVVRLVELLSQVSFLQEVGSSLFRLVLGFGLAVCIAVPVGLVLGWNHVLYSYFEFIIEFLRPLPSAAIIPISILFLGIENEMKIFVIVFGSIWPILISTMDGVKDIEPQYFRTAQSFRIKGLKLLLRVIFPSTLPGILTGMRVSVAISLILAITVEMIVGGDGLGYFILDSERSFRFTDMYAGVIFVGIIGYIINLTFVAADKRLLHWRQPIADEP